MKNKCPTSSAGNATIRPPATSSVSASVTPTAHSRAAGRSTNSNNGSISRPRSAKTIIKQSDRLANLVKSIINFSQIDSDELPDEDVNLSELVREAASVFEPKLQKRSISFTLDVAENVKVRSRRERLFEIVNNLISNGVRYNRDGGTLAVTLTGGEEPVFTVRDTGIGIAEEDKERIFDRFYTVDK